MGYRIDYVASKEPLKKQNHLRLPLLTMLSFFLFLILVNFLWPEGKAVLLEYLPLGEGTAVFSALDVAASELSRGAEAAGTFRTFLDSLS